MAKVVPSSIGRYDVVAPLASGGMGELFLARRSGKGGFARLVVLKRLLPELGATATYRDMFFDEARIAARLSHPNVCEVYDLEEVGDAHYLAMPYLEGVSLAALTPVGEVDEQREATGGGDPTGSAGGAGGGAPRGIDLAHVRLIAGVLVQVCDGLQHAHELTGDDGQPLGVVHRDVSPGNVLITSDGIAKLLDFGVAKVRDATATTEQGIVKGKLAYMAPEQLAGGAIDRRADLFSVGVLGWEGVTGRRLFQRGSASLTAAAVLDEPIPRADGDAVPPALADVWARALARDPGARPPTARALREAIEAALAEHGGPMRAGELAPVLAARFAAELASQRARARTGTGAAGPAAPAAPSPPPEELTAPTRPERLELMPTTVRARALPPTRRRPVLAVSLAALVLAVAALAWAIGRGPSPSRAASPVATLSENRTVAPPPSAPPPSAPVPAPAAPPPDRAPVPAEPAEPSRRRPPPVDRAPASGFVSIESQPWAELTIDGHAAGPTPLIRRALAPGRHKIRAVLADGRSRTFSIDVVSGREASPVNLSW